jgi:hypothetical protein
MAAKKRPQAAVDKDLSAWVRFPSELVIYPVGIVTYSTQ